MSYTKIDMKIGIAINKCRKLKGITLSDVATQCGVSEAYLSLLESGKRRLNFSMLQKIAKAIEVPAGIIVFMASDEKEIKELDHKLHGELKVFITGVLHGKKSPRT